MATYNNKTKTPDANDEESHNGSSVKVMLRPGSHSVIEKFDNDI